MSDKDKSNTKHKRDGVTEVVSVLEELASALVMALMIIGFVIQPFIIPTGSMAETLKGAHFRLCCPQCGFHYDRDYQSSEYGLGNSNAIVRGRVYPPTARCPSCGYNYSSDEQIQVTKGDKILAAKCLYQFFEPKRWDVVVFKNPVQPEINYIKRLVAKPNETVQIIDGDVYIDGLIARKPPKVQNEQWMIIYDSEQVPARPEEKLFNGHTWRQPMVNYGQSRWEHKANGAGKFILNKTAGQEHKLAYDTSAGNDFRTTYGYNDIGRYGLMPTCSDLKITFEVTLTDANTVQMAGAALRKYQRYYKAYVTNDGMMTIKRDDGRRNELLAQKQIEIPPREKPIDVSFSNVDHMLIFEFGGEKLWHDLGREPDSAGAYCAEAEPEVEILGSGELSVSHIRIYRDIYYRNRGGGPGSNAVEEPMKLNDDEFFVLGDNSPASFDSRWWPKPGIGNNGEQYRVGVVPRDYLMGKALAVFWPSGFKPFEKFPFRIVPNIRGLKLIYGGSNKKLND